MGMFDTVHVAKSLIDDLIKDDKGINLMSEDGYYLFQTKDLDNLMFDFYIELDGSFFFQKRYHKWVPPDESRDNFNFGHMEEYKEPEMILDNRSVYVHFYDGCKSETDSIFITFKAHLNNGKLQSPISIHEITKTSLKELELSKAEFDLKWAMIRADKRWIIGSLIRKIRFKISRFFNPLIRAISKFEDDLIGKAREEHFPKTNKN